MKRTIAFLMIGMLCIMAANAAPNQERTHTDGIVFSQGHYDINIDRTVSLVGDQFCRVFVAAPDGVITRVEIERSNRFTHLFREADRAFNERSTPEVINEADLYADCKKFVLHGSVGVNDLFNDADMAFNCNCYNSIKRDRSWCQGRDLYPSLLRQRTQNLPHKARGATQNNIS